MAEKRLYGIRGAVSCENTSASITEAVGDMCRRIFTDNGLYADDIVSVQFTVTDDLDALNPATALRLAPDTGLDVSGIPLFCSQEAKIAGMPEKIIRVLVTAYMESGSKVISAYLGDAQKLRPDLQEGTK